MAVTARSRLPWYALLSILASGLPVRADRAADIRTLLGNISTSLAAANPSDAMGPFDKSYASYEKLTEDFAGLTVFQLENEVDVTDEEDTADGAKIVIDWALTLTDLGTSRTDHRTAVINARVVLKGGKWKIVEFSPIAIFNPLPRWNSKP